jgi:transcriptional regulator with XRE-family HTH domain
MILSPKKIFNPLIFRMVSGRIENWEPKMKERKYENYGHQCRAIRQRLRLTLEDLHKEIGISASYISDFERGLKLPTAKYLRHLHDKHGVNLNFIFCGEGRMFRLSERESEIKDFGKFQEEVDEMLEYMSRVPHSLYQMLVHFSEYKVENEAFLSKFMPSKTSKDTEDSAL